MNSSLSRSLVLLCGSLTLAMTACVGAPDEEGAEEDEVSTVESPVTATALIDTDALRGSLTAMWKKQLNTTRDPANGQWLTKGADGDSPAGLYGAMSLTPDQSIAIDQSKRTYSKSSFMAHYVNADNRNGLNPKTVCALKSTVTSSSSTTHSVENAINTGFSATVKGNATLFGTGVEASATASIGYTHSWGKSTTNTSGVSAEFSATITATVPKGKIYRCELTGVIRNFTVPYTVVARVSGFTETWFSDRVNGHYNHALGGGSAFQLIRDWNLAGGESGSFSSAGLTQRGTLKASTVGNFTTKIVDITGK